MYFPVGLPQEFRFPKDNPDLQQPLVICSNRDRSLILLLTENTLHIWFCKPCVQITALQRSAHSIRTAGKNVNAVWKSDATTILVTTDKGGLLFFKLEINNDSDGPTTLYLKKGHTKRQNVYDAMFLGEGIPALTLKQLHTYNLGHQISSVALLRDELVVCTTEGDIMRIGWDCKVNTACSTHIKEIQFGYDLQQTRGQRMKDATEYVIGIEYSPLLGGFVAVLSDGRGFFLTAPNSRFDKGTLRGIWAADLRNATCVHANHKYRLIVYGCSSGKGMVYHIDPATGALALIHELLVPSKDYPDAGVVGGAISKLAWTPDECAIVAAWSKGGIAVWSVFGALLYCSLQNNSGMPSPVSDDRMVVDAMEWGAEGFQLWMSVRHIKDIQTTSSNSSSVNGTSEVTVRPAAVTSTVRGNYDFIQMNFVKSPLTVNPCLSNHKHLFLQGEDRIYINIGNDSRTSQKDASNILIANKQWRIVNIISTYLGSNWPIKYSAIDDSGTFLAVAGRFGLTHISLLKRKWILFGNEAQEKNVVVSGGLLWWKGFICAGCYNLQDHKDEIRFYPRECRLDNSFCTESKVPSAILLINIFEDYLICLCADRHIMIFSLERIDTQGSFPRVDIKRIQEVSVDGFIPHPMCVTFITLSTLKAETVITQDRTQVDSSNNIPESILMNVAGRLLMFQRDWSRPQPKNASTRLRSVPFCNPMMVASSVENVWLPDVDCNSVKEQITNALWLSSGASGMKVWLTLAGPDSVQTHSFMSRRNMLPFDIDIYPLAVLADDAVILGAASDHTSSSTAATPCSPTSSPSSNWLRFAVIERTSQIYLHQVLRQLLRQNLGYHALRLARCFTNLPYFSHILELLLHKVLEEEATSKEAIPDPLLPRVVAFAKEFPQYRETIVHCARKTEFALWDHLFSTVGSPKALFEQCLVGEDLNTAASYLIILQNLEKYYISRQLATLLLEAVLEKRYWALARDVVRHLKAIDPSEAEIELVSRSVSRYGGQRYPTSQVDEDDVADVKPPLTRHPSLSFYEAENRMKVDKTAKTDQHPSVSRKSSVSASKQEAPEIHNIDKLLYKHAKKLLSLYRVKDLGLFAANLEDYELVAFLRKERIRGARIEDPVAALKQLHNDFMWPLPVLTHSAYHNSFDSYKAQRSQMGMEADGMIPPLHDNDLTASQSTTRELFLNPSQLMNSTEELDNDVGTEGTCSDMANDEVDIIAANDLSRASSESQLHLWSIELASRGPEQSERELRYLHQVMVEAECYDWCLLISVILRDQHLFTRSVQLSAQLAEMDGDYVSKLCTLLTKLKQWSNNDCLGYKPFFSTVGDFIDSLIQLNDRCATRSRHLSNQHSSSLSSDTADSSNDRVTTITTSSTEQSVENYDNSQSESCIIS